MTGEAFMKQNRKAFLQALAVFVAVIAGSMLFKGGPHLMRGQRGQPAATGIQSPPPLSAADKERFKIIVSFTVKPDLTQSAAWMPGTVNGIPAWHDSRTGLVWGPMLKDIAIQELITEELDRARAACATQEPKGAWALPLAHELDAASNSGLAEADPDSRRSWFTYDYVGTRPRAMGRMWDHENTRMVYFVRCVARTEQ
jgi:hypothetical protein